MKAFRVFILGLLYGWLAKFAIDRIYRKNDLEDLRNENASLKEYIHSLEARLQSQTAVQARTAPGKDDLKVIKGIGPAIERKLNEAGVDSFAALARLSVEELENILGSTKRLVKEGGSLIAQAKELAQQE